MCRVVALVVCTGWLHWLCVQGGCTGCAYRVAALVVCRVVALVVCRVVALVVCRVVALVVRTGWLHWLCGCTGCV